MGRIRIRLNFKKVVVIFFTFLIGFNFQLSAFSKAVLPVLDKSHSGNFIILTKKDFVANLKMIENIFPNYEYSYITTEDIGGNDPLQVRKYLFSHFNQGYLLIALSEKDLEPGTLTIGGNESFSPKVVKSDLFYALEDIDFDNDGDFGEFYDDILKTGVNFRFVVGRLPFEKGSEFTNYFTNLKEFQGKKSKVLFASSFISFPGETYDGGKILTGDGARLMELLRKRFFFDAVTLYEKEGDFPSIYECDKPLNNENFINEAKDATLILWDAHGSQNASYTEIWLDKNNNGIPESNEFTFKPFISSSDTFSTNAIVFSGSCLNLQGYNNLGYAFLKNGSVAFIGSREVSYTPSYFTKENDGGSSSIMYYFVKFLYEGDTVGDALYNSFLYYYKNLLYNDLEDPIESGILNIYDFNIYGVPTIKFSYGQIRSSYEKKLTQKEIYYKFNYDSKTREFEINISYDKPYFVILPKGLFVKNVIYLDSKNSPIYDWFFNIIRSNYKGTLVIEGVVRGIVEDSIIVKGDNFQNEYQVSLSGFDMRDFNFDSKVDDKDFEMLKECFGKTYMNKDFLPQCDLDCNLRVDGIDVLLFRKGS